MKISAKKYNASMEANRRMMDTTIWQACRIMGVPVEDVNTGKVKSGDVFHSLYEKFYAEEMAK